MKFGINLRRRQGRSQTTAETTTARADDIAKRVYDAMLWGNVGFERLGIGAHTSGFGNQFMHMMAAIDPPSNTVIHSALRQLVSSVETVRFGVIDRDADEDDEPDFTHPAAEVINWPGLGRSRRELMWAMVESLLIAGNCLLVPYPHALDFPHWKNVRLPQLGDWRYRVRYPMSAHWQVFEPDNVAHLRHHMSPDGYSGVGALPLSALTDITTDREAQTFAAAVLANMGVASVFFFPKLTGPGSDIMADDYTQADADAMMKMMNKSFAGAKRGRAAAVTKPWDMVEPGAGSASKVDFSGVRNSIEERLLACMGIHPALIGIGTGSQNTRVGATMVVLRRHYAQTTVQPLARLIAEQLTVQLLPFYAPEGRFKILPDFSQNMAVEEAITEIQSEKADYLLKMVQAGEMTSEEALEEMEGA